MGYLSNVEDKRRMEEVLRYEESHPTINRLQFDEDAKIFLVGDEHIGHAQYNEEKHMRNLEWAYDNGVFILHMGDGIETATRNSIGAGVYTQEEIVDEQVTKWQTAYEPFVKDGRFIGAHIGNHEARVFNDEGMNIMRTMCRAIGAKYLGIGKVHLLRVGKQTYTMYTTHGSSGARLPYTKIKGALDLEKIIEADVYAMGHVHQLSNHTREFYKVDKRRKKVTRGVKHFVLTGSYLDYWNSYAQVKCMEPCRNGSPLLTFDSKTKQVNISTQ